MVGDSIQNLVVEFLMSTTPGFQDCNGVVNLGGNIVTVGPDKLSLSADGTQLTVVIPNTVTLGLAKILVLRSTAVAVRKTTDNPTGWTTPQQSGNAVQINSVGSYAFAALPRTGSVEVINEALTVNLSAYQGQVPADILTPTQLANLPHPDDVAQIRVDPQNPDPAPFAIAVTPDGSRAYVTLANDHGIAVVDALALQEVNVPPPTPFPPNDPRLLQTNHIVLAATAMPGFITVDSAGRYAYVSDQRAGTVYIISVDPLSPFYNQIVGTLSATLGLAHVGPAWPGVGSCQPFSLCRGSGIVRHRRNQRAAVRPCTGIRCKRSASCEICEGNQCRPRAVCRDGCLRSADGF